MDPITEVITAGLAAFGELHVEQDALAAMIAAIGDPELVRTHAAEIYLGAACVAGRPAALARLDEVYITRVAHVLARKQLPSHAIDDIRQTVRERLLGARDGGPPYLAHAVGRGSLASLIAVIATRAAVDWVRAAARGGAATAADEHDELIATGDPARDYVRAKYRSEVKAAFEAAIADLPTRERTLLRLHLVDGLTIDDLARTYQLHRATMARQLERAREQVATTTRKLLARITGLHGDELAELGTLVTSQLDLSLSRVLG